MGKGQKAKGESKYAHLLLEDEGFNAWYRNVMKGSANTGSAYLRRLGRLRDELYKVTPRHLASMTRTELTTFASNVISDLEETGMKGDAIKSYIKAIKSWAEFNDKKIEKKLNIEEGTKYQSCGEAGEQASQIGRLHQPLLLRHRRCHRSRAQIPHEIQTDFPNLT